MWSKLFRTAVVSSKWAAVELLHFNLMAAMSFQRLFFFFPSLLQNKDQQTLLNFIWQQKMCIFTLFFVWRARTLSERVSPWSEPEDSSACCRAHQDPSPLSCKTQNRSFANFISLKCYYSSCNTRHFSFNKLLTVNSNFDCRGRNSVCGLAHPLSLPVGFHPVSPNRKRNYVTAKK